MGRQYDIFEKAGMDEKKNYESPTCNELKKIVGQDQFTIPWSKEDELLVLEKLFQFSTKNNNPSNCYTTHFYNHVNKMLSVQLFENQLCYMIFLLRKQYYESPQNQKDLDSHSLQLMKLSAKIWNVDSNDIDLWRPKTSVVRDLNEKDLRKYVVEAIGSNEADCLSPYVMEELSKDWQHFKFVENEFRRMQLRLSLRLSEFKAHMHNTHLQLPKQNLA